jgi:large subunit ribosomal protein L30
VKGQEQKTIHIKWVRSGIGFTRLQKTIVRSLGLGRLNQVVERQDTPQIRGMVEAVPHLVEIVSLPKKPAWVAVPEYTILPPDPEAAPAPKRRKAERKVEEVEAPAAEAAEPKAEKEEKESKKAKPEKAAAHAPKAKKAAKGATEKHKAEKAGDAKKSKAAKSSKPAKKTKK